MIEESGLSVLVQTDAGGRVAVAVEAEVIGDRS